MVISDKNWLNIFMNNVVGRDCCPIFKHNHPYFIFITINLLGGLRKDIFSSGDFSWKDGGSSSPKYLKTSNCPAVSEILNQRQTSCFFYMWKYFTFDILFVSWLLFDGNVCLDLKLVGKSGLWGTKGKFWVEVLL